MIIIICGLRRKRILCNVQGLSLHANFYYFRSLSKTFGLIAVTLCPGSFAIWVCIAYHHSDLKAEMNEILWAIPFAVRRR